MAPKTATRPPRSAQKRGSLKGRAAQTPDVLASSKKILQPTRPGGGQKGLQQFFTPPEVANFARMVVQFDKIRTFDPTAGDGALLAAAPRKSRFGVEIDPDHTDDASYHALRGDIQQVYPILRASGVKFNRIVSNPPFGLDDWSDPRLSGGKNINSTLLTFRYCLGLLDEHGIGLFIAGRDRFNKLVIGGDPLDSKAVLATIEIDKLFDGVELPCVIAFFTHGTNRTKEPQAKFTAEVSDLSDPKFAATVRAAITAGASYVTNMPDVYARTDDDPMVDEWEAFEDEYNRRLKGRELTQDYDLMIKGGKLSVKPSPFAKIAINKRGYQKLAQFEALNGQSVSYFSLNIREWNQVQDFAAEGMITIDPAALVKIEKSIEKGRMQMRPMYPIPPQMRLGFLDDVERIECIKTDEEKGFAQGEWYPIKVASKVTKETETRLHERRDGLHEPRRYEKERKILSIRIDRQTFDENPEDIVYLTEHFALPDVGDLAENHPVELQRARDTLKAIADENDFTWDDFQMEDLARCVIKERALLAWSMGGGKTAGILGASEAWVRLGVAKNRVLIIAPQDLHQQWQREAAKFLGSTGRTLEPIITPADAERVARHIKHGGEGWYITSYEALSIVGTKGTRKLGVNVLADPSSAPSSEGQGDEPQSRMEVTTEEACPSCRENSADKWSGTFCASCGYAHYEVRVKSAASRLSTAFKDGVICVDELSMVRGDYSQRSLALRGLRSRCRLGASGTPISNYVNDCFWGLAWTIGWGSARFPYDYEEGKTKFEKDFCVLEYMMGSKDSGKANQRERRKVLPEVTNLSMLWKLLSISMVRRRQVDMGEMVERTFHTIEAPMGIEQLKMNDAWLRGFESFFTEKNPDHPVVEAGMVEKFQAALGLLWKMEYSATLPEADPDLNWITENGPAYGAKRDDNASLLPNNFTPKFIKALEIIEKHVAAGEKVLVGSCLVDTGPLISKLLTARGIKAAHITDVDKNGKAKTKNPRKRAQAVTDFVQGDTDVLCAGVQAMKLGHNLDVASTVVLIGFPWSYEAFEQFLARVWRRTSKRPVSVYALLAKGTIDERKYKLLSDKAAASDVALDGRLIEENEKPQNWNKVLQEMKQAGIKADGDEVPETAIEEAWKSRPRPKLRSLYTNRRNAHPGGIKPLKGTAKPKYKLATGPGQQSSFFD